MRRTQPTLGRDSCAGKRVHTCRYTHTHTGRHTYVMTRLCEMEPQRATITCTQQAAGSCLFVCDFRACCAQLQPAVCVCVCRVYHYSCLVEFLPSRMLLPPLSTVTFRPLVGLCSVTWQNFSITPVISPHAKSLLSSASSVFYTKEAIICFVVRAPLQRADIIFPCISGNSNERISRRANAYWARLPCQTMAGG